MAATVIDGRFHLRKELGKGAWGKLFSADDKPRHEAIGGGLFDRADSKNGVGVVIEVVSSRDNGKLESIEQEMRTFFGAVREMKEIMGAEATHLLDCRECGRDQEERRLVYLATEGWTGSLEDRLKTPGALSDQDLALVARSVSQALAHLHSRGIHHAGIHPSRIVYVADKWKLVPSGPTGTIGPRISLPETETSTAGDIYAFGLTLLHAFLTLRGKKVELKGLESNYEKWLPTLTEPWRFLVGRCLQKEPKRRCTADELHLVATPQAQPVTELAGQCSPEHNTVAQTPKKPPRSRDVDIAVLEQHIRALHAEFKTTKASLEAAQNNRVIRLGLCGVRGSGKSSLLAAWRLRREDPKNKMLLRFSDDDSIAYLEKLYFPRFSEGCLLALTPSLC